MVDLSLLKKGKIIKNSNGEYNKVIGISECNNVYYIKTKDCFKSNFYNRDGTEWNNPKSNNKIIKIL